MGLALAVSKARISARLEGFSLKMPRRAPVTMVLPGLWMPRMVMQVWVASTTQAAPMGLSCSIRASAIWVVRRSWTCGRRANPPPGGQFAQAYDFAVGQIGDVNASHERQEVVFTERMEFDIAEEHHFVISLVKDRAQMLARILLQAGEQFGIGPRRRGWGFSAGPHDRGSSPTASRISRTARSMPREIDVGLGFGRRSH